MHILICDDDAAFGARVAQYVTTYFEGHEIPVQSTLCSSPQQVLDTPNLELYQLAFLDVSMPELNGIALGGLLKQHNPEIRLVYVSAYLDFAIDGYKVSAYRYILKPNAVNQLPSCLDDIYAEMMHNCRFLTLHCNREIVQIPLNQIYYLESGGRKLYVYGDIPHTILATANSKLTDLPPVLFQSGFLQVERSTVVNLKYVHNIRNYKVEMQNGVELSVSRSKYSVVRGAYLEWKGQYGDA